MPKTTTPLIVSLLISVCISAPTQASPGNKYGWCHGVGNPHHSAGCGGLPPNPPQTLTPVVTVNSVNENRPQPMVVPPQPPAQQVPPDPVIAVPQPVLPPQQVPQPTIGAAQIPVTSQLTAPSGHQTQIFQPMTLVVPDLGRQQVGRLHRIVQGEGDASTHIVCLVSGMGRRKLREADEEVGQFSGFHLTDAIVRDLPFDRHPYAGCFISVERRWHDQRLPSEAEGQ